VIDEVGELVITEPMPSMPTSFWDDADGTRYRDSYFDVYPGVWRHGDWIKITERGSCVIYGRSDATLNREGVRVGTSELYRVVEALPEIRESLVVDTGELGVDGELVLFVVLDEGRDLDEALRARLRNEIRTQLSPRHVPNEIIPVPDIPKTLSGKRLEVPVKRILLGANAEDVVSPDALANPDALRAFAEFSRERRKR
jgi:acetoacetyl-CoA synthetase